MKEISIKNWEEFGTSFNNCCIHYFPKELLSKCNDKFWIQEDFQCKDEEIIQRTV